MGLVLVHYVSLLFVYVEQERLLIHIPQIWLDHFHSFFQRVHNLRQVDRNSDMVEMHLDSINGNCFQYHFMTVLFHVQLHHYTMPQREC
jgi:hypothetical protein